MATDFQVFSSDRYLLPTKYRRKSPHITGNCHPTPAGGVCFFPIPVFSFSSCLSAESFFHRTRDRNSVALLLTVQFPGAFSICYRTQRVRVYLIHPFRCKVSYRYVDLKGHAPVSSMPFLYLKNLPFFSPQATIKTSIFSRKPCKHSHGTLVKHRKGYIKR